MLAQCPLGDRFPGSTMGFGQAPRYADRCHVVAQACRNASHTLLPARSTNAGPISAKPKHLRSAVGPCPAAVVVLSSLPPRLTPPPLAHTRGHGAVSACLLSVASSHQPISGACMHDARSISGAQATNRGCRQHSCPLRDTPLRASDMHLQAVPPGLHQPTFRKPLHAGTRHC